MLIRNEKDSGVISILDSRMKANGKYKRRKVRNILNNNGQTLLNIIWKRGGGKMEVIVYYPQNEKDIIELHKNVSKVHAEIVKNYIDKLTCPKDTKIRLLKTVQDKVRETENL